MVKTKQFLISEKVKVRRKKSKKALSVYRPLPQAMKLRIRARTYETATSTASPVYYRYGLVEFLGLSGSYSDSLYGLYKYARIHACKITVRAVNVGSEPAILAVAPLPHDWTMGSPTVAEILDLPKCKRTTLSSYTGMDRAEISSYSTVAEVLGDEWQVARYNMDVTQAISSTPLVANEPAWTVLFTSFNATTSVSYRLEIELEFDVKFFDLSSV